MREGEKRKGMDRMGKRSGKWKIWKRWKGRKGKGKERKRWGGKSMVG